MAAPALAIDPKYLGETRVELDGRTVYQSLTKQDILHHSKALNILYGGAAGGGKSHGLRWHGHIVALTTPGTHILLLRRFSTELEKHHLLLVGMDLPTDKAVYNASQKRVKYHNGSLLQFGHCNNDQDFAQWLSTEWDLILIDESGEFTPYQLQLIPTRTGRSRKSRGQVISCSNPGGPGHQFNYTRYIAKQVEEEDDPTYKPQDYQFIFADIEDNPYLSPKYIERILSAPPTERRRFLGDWEIPTGNLFEELERALHLNFDDVPYPQTRRVVAADWGWSAFAPAIWFESDTGFEGPVRHRAYREWYPKKTVPPVWARGVARRSEGQQVEAVVLDSACWNQGADGGPSIAEQMLPVFSDAGIRLIPSNKGPGSVERGIQLMHTYLWTAEGQVVPLLTIHASCRKLWSDLITVQRGDPAKGQDPDVPPRRAPQLHGIDCVRYFLQSRPAPAELSLEERLLVDDVYQAHADDHRSLQAAYEKRAKDAGLPLVRVKEAFKTKRRKYAWTR